MRLRKLKRRPGGGPPGASAPGHSSREATAPSHLAGAPRCPTVPSQRSNQTPQGHSRMPSAETLPLPTERSWRVRQTKFELEPQMEEERKRRGKEKGIPFVSNPPTHRLGVRACSTRVLRGRPGAWLCTPTRTCAHTCAHVHTRAHSHVHTHVHTHTRPHSAHSHVHTRAPGHIQPCVAGCRGLPEQRTRPCSDRGATRRDKPCPPLGPPRAVGTFRRRRRRERRPHDMSARAAPGLSAAPRIHPGQTVKP